MIRQIPILEEWEIRDITEKNLFLTLCLMCQLFFGSNKEGQIYKLGCVLCNNNDLNIRKNGLD